MRRFAIFDAFLIYALLSPVAITAQEATPTLAALPEATAPLGLGSVTLPGDEAEIIALLASLPAEVAGEQRAGDPAQRDGRIVITYGETDPSLGPTLLVQAVDFSRSTFFPADFTAVAYVATAALSTDDGAVAAGRDGEIVWIRAESSVGVAGGDEGTPEISLPVYTLAWGTADSRWLFSAASFTPDGLDALVTAFVHASGGAPATPIATPASG